MIYPHDGFVLKRSYDIVDCFKRDQNPKTLCVVGFELLGGYCLFGQPKTICCSKFYCVDIKIKKHAIKFWPEIAILRRKKNLFCGFFKYHCLYFNKTALVLYFRRWRELIGWDTLNCCFIIIGFNFDFRFFLFYV